MPSFFQSIDHDIDVKVDIDVRYVYVSAWGFERRDRDQIRSMRNIGSMTSIVSMARSVDRSVGMITELPVLCTWRCQRQCMLALGAGWEVW